MMVETMSELVPIQTERKPLQKCYDNLEHIIDESRRKFDMQTTSNSDKQKWGRLLITAIEAWAHLSEASDVNEILDRLVKYEKEVKF